ncbi:MAG: hypothetical protein Q8Q33_08770, partial [Chlamydiota bacterium]|nr:hypothetical protein [Chlamydiota bacterium]
MKTLIKPSLHTISSTKLLLVLAILNMGLWAFPFMKYIKKFEPSGDEPHYLIITQSLIQDQDLDLKNNYQNKDYKAYFKRMDLEANPTIIQHEKWDPICNIGLPFIAIAGFLA